MYHVPEVKCSLSYSNPTTLQGKKNKYLPVTCNVPGPSVDSCQGIAHVILNTTLCERSCFSFHRRRNGASVEVRIWQSSTLLVTGKLKSIQPQRLYPQNDDLSNVWFSVCKIRIIPKLTVENVVWIGVYTLGKCLSPKKCWSKTFRQRSLYLVREHIDNQRHSNNCDLMIHIIIILYIFHIIMVSEDGRGGYHIKELPGSSFKEF